MRARLLSVFLLFILSFALASNALAHDDQNAHDADLRYALFGDREKALSGKQLLSFKVIADAAAITIDQFSPSETLKWKKNVFQNLLYEVLLIISLFSDHNGNDLQELKLQAMLPG